MFATPAFAQAAGAAAQGGSNMDAFLQQMLFIVPLFLLGYFFLWRPQQQRMKRHREMVSGMKRGDTVVLASGMIGKIVRVEDAEVGVEIATGVTVKVVKSMISEVRTRGEPAPANDAKK